MSTSKRRKGKGKGSKANVGTAEKRRLRSYQRHDYSKYDPSPIEKIVYSIGQCIGFGNCKEGYAELANGWCVKHWDLGKGSLASKKPAKRAET
jgi:hypothetical protein